MKSRADRNYSGCAHGSMLRDAGVGDWFLRAGLDYIVLPLLMAFAEMAGFALVWPTQRVCI